MMQKKAPMSFFENKSKKKEDFQFSMKDFLYDVFGDYECIMESVLGAAGFDYQSSVLGTDDYDYLVSLDIDRRSAEFSMRRVIYESVSSDGRSINASSVLSAKVGFSCDNDAFEYEPESFFADDIDLNMAGVRDIESLVNFIKVRKIAAALSFFHHRVKITG